jgi:hypothetical protein
MTKTKFLVALCLSFSLIMNVLNAQNVGINTTTPDASAALDITATDKGMLVPRLTTTQRTAISSPAIGLLVFDTTLGQFYFYSGSAWTAIPLSNTTSGVNYVGTSYLGTTSGAGSTGTSEGTSSNLYNIGIGASVLNANTTGNNNVALGQNALKANTIGREVVAIGHSALQNHVSSLDGSSTSNAYGPDLAIGTDALSTETVSGGNTAIGYQSQKKSDNGTGASANTSVGSYALRSNGSGASNTAIGFSALYLTSSGIANTAIGNGAGLTNTTGSSNTFIGGEADAMSNNLTYATAIGKDAKVASSNSLVLGGTGSAAVKVGIGTTSPSEVLDVIGKTKTTTFQMTTSPTSGYVLQSDASGNGTWVNPTTLSNGNWTTSGSNQYSALSGNVGIGTNTPTKAKLEVNGSTNQTLSYGYLRSTGSTGTESSQTNGYSIYASARIAGTEFNAFSDRRIKKILRGSNSNEDLTTLMKIKITDYKLIDSIAKGNKAYKKVIAQELAEVYPNAVSKMTDVVPNIYKLATVKNGFIDLKNHGLVVGDKVKLIFENKQDLFKVLEINDLGFKIEFLSPNTEGGKNGSVFVFGKEVNDFHTVDYEALSTLNISATQELVKQINDLKTEKVRMQSELEGLKAEVSEIKRLLQKEN